MMYYKHLEQCLNHSVKWIVVVDNIYWLLAMYLRWYIIFFRKHWSPKTSCDIGIIIISILIERNSVQFSSVQSSRSVKSNSLWHHGLQHARLPCPSPTPGACLNSCPSSRWCHPTSSSSVIPLSSHLIFPRIRVFSSESVLCIRWPQYWSFSLSISPSNKYSGLISFRIDWIDLFARDSQESSPTPQLKSINSSMLSFLYCSTLTSIHDHCKNHSLTIQTFVGKVTSLLFNMLSRLVIAFLPRSKRLLISWLQSPSAVILEPPK